MKTVYLMNMKSWKYININDDLFNSLWNQGIIHFTNDVYALKPYDKNFAKISVNIPINREFSALDFTIADNGKIKSVISYVLF